MSETDPAHPAARDGLSAADEPDERKKPDEHDQPDERDGRPDAWCPAPGWHPAVTTSVLPADPDPHAPSSPSAASSHDRSAAPEALSHGALKSLLGAWALAVCSPWETEAVERHLDGCGSCADEALLLRKTISLLRPAASLDLDAGLRARILEAGLARRAPRIPVPAWTAPYDAETARLDALLQDIDAPEWHAPVQLRWYENDLPVSREATVAEVLGHLLAVDGLVAVALGLVDPLGDDAPSGLDAVKRTEAYWRAASTPQTSAIRDLWRGQSRSLVRTAAHSAATASGATGSGHLPRPSGSSEDTNAGHGTHVGIAARPVPYGTFVLPLRDALVDRAFECWIHGSDIAAAVDYPYGWPVPRHMHAIVDLTVRRLPGALAVRRTPGVVPHALQAAGEVGEGRVLRLEVEGASGGEWLIGLDSPGAARSVDGRGDGTRQAGCEVAHVALDDSEFCRLAAGHISPQEAAAGSTGDQVAIADVLTAVASLSRM